MKFLKDRKETRSIVCLQSVLSMMGCLLYSVFLSSGCGSQHALQTQSPATQTSTYYVSTSGDNSNAGTLAAPWRTIQHAANMVTAGDTVYVQSGVYNEIVTMQTSGTASAPIVFSSYPGDIAIVDGTGLSIPNGVSGLFTVQNLNYITIEGFEIRNFTSSTTD